MKFVDVRICNEEDAEKSFRIKSERTDVKSEQLSDAGYVHSAEMIFSQYGSKYIATPLRRSYSASRNGWRAMFYDAEALKSYFSRDYDIQLVDRVGGASDLV